MQYSLRWIFVAMVYVATVVVAFKGDWLSADILSVVSLLAVVYALLLAWFARGHRQVIAAGFVIASSIYICALFIGQGEYMPTSRLLDAVGIGPDSPNPWPIERAPYLRAANAVGMIAFGLAGCVLGALAFRAVGAKSTALKYGAGCSTLVGRLHPRGQ